MPSSLHPQAKFDPIPPDLDLHDLVSDTPNFEWATHISASEIFTLGQQRFEQLVYFHVINGGKPLVINNWNERLPTHLFSAQWLQDNYNKKEENVWDINNKSNIPMTMGHYLRSMKQLTDQWTPRNFRDERRQRLYLKDMDCPPEWHERLRKALPLSIFYLNESVDPRAGNRGTDDDGMFVDTHQAARAGDLMSSLPPEMRAENLMCYIGHEGTYTPAHREMCASLGQNIMVEASGSDNGERPGSSIWFMTETKDREVVGEYFLSMLGHDVEIEKHFAQINAWKKATFPVYIVEQRPGDLILVPPLAPHQVWNRGTRTIKVAWNRTVVETLDMALHEALPKARLVCRDEQYKNKAIIYYTLGKYYTELEDARADPQLASLGFSQDVPRSSVRTQQVAGDFKKLLQLFTEILVDEMFGTREKSVEFIAFDSNITCSYCRANIFNRFLTCTHCTRQLVDGDDDTYDICMECYAMGRSCACVSGLGWCEQWRWEELVANYERWRAMVISNDGFIDAFTSPSALEVAKLRAGRKPVAQICQEQLRRRPFRDIHQPQPEKTYQELSEPEVDEDGRVKKKKKPARKAKKGDTYRCHSCCHKDHRYRLAFCTTPGCAEAYCYGVLYRGFDMMPQTVMQQEFWRCPRCMNICNCGACRRGGLTKPYVPKSTLLGHDTRPIADDRSVESLINFKLHNLLWLRNAGEEGRSKDSTRMQRLRRAADEAKAAQQPQQGEDMDAHDMDGMNGAEGMDGFEAQNGEYSRQDEDVRMLDNDYTTDVPHSAYPMANGSGGDARAPLGEASLDRQSQSLQDYPDPSGYPDPLMASDEMAMFGRAYYQNDDSPDKILFDPYSEPLPHQLPAGLELMDEPPEFLDSFEQRPARRPRQEKDVDPEYRERKMHRKKPRPASDLEMHLDPALLTANAPPAVPGVSPGASVVADGGSSGSSGMVSHDATTSSAGRVFPVLAAPAPPALPASMAPVASIPVAPIEYVPTQMDGNAESPPAAAEPDESADSDEGAEESGSPVNVPKLRHARPKASYVVEVESDADDELLDMVTSPTAEQAETSKQAKPVTAQAETPKAAGTPAKRRPGRPRKQQTLPGAASKMPEEEVPQTTSKKPEEHSQVTTKPREVSQATSKPREQLPQAPTQFMSMAERMALLGKKFRIRSQKEAVVAGEPKPENTESVAKPATVPIKRANFSVRIGTVALPRGPQQQAASAKVVEKVVEQQVESIASLPPAKSSVRRPTVVRLMESDSSDDGSDQDGSSAGSVVETRQLRKSSSSSASYGSDDHDDHDDDRRQKPAPQPPKFYARRGGGRGRGGRGRGRGQGRGRGSAAGRL